MALFKNKYRIESARLKGWDYRRAGCYFVTLCAHQREHYFGAVEGADVRLSAIGEIAALCWADIPNHHQGIELDEWIVMPNHMHGIIVIVGNDTAVAAEALPVAAEALPVAVEALPVAVETLHCNVSTTNTPTDPRMSAISPKMGSLAVVVRSYKSAVTRRAHEAGHTFKWQERFWDRIIRNEAELNRIRRYIRANPANWAKDRNNTGLWM